ncbi:MAG: sulfotransferase domain-containing protein [bacterium]|nr:sulfotransferase domain-containing protein [bacterium]
MDSTTLRLNEKEESIDAISKKLMRRHKRLKRIKRRIKAKMLQSAIYLNRCLHNYTDVIWLVADGRSGSTWVTNLINYQKRYRIMFEPFHPYFIPQMPERLYFQYFRPNSTPDRFDEFARSVFTGKLTHYRVDGHILESNPLFFKGLLIKDIFAHLFLKWGDVHFPDVHKLLLLRHPCAVALSKEKLQHRKWIRNPEDLLRQNELSTDYLRPFEPLIRSAGSFFEKQITIWSIIHAIPLRQFRPGQIHLIFYEELCTDPQRELQRLFSYLGAPFDTSNLHPQLAAQLKIPSRTCREESAIKTGHNLIDTWRSELTAAQIKRAVEILRAFGLDKIYNDALIPDCEAAERMLAAP